MTCTKKKHSTYWDAIIWHQTHIPNGRLKPFYTYQCDQCNEFHIATHDLPEGFYGELQYKIKNGKSECIKKLSNYKSIHNVKTDIGKFKVLYKSKKGKVEITILEQIVV